MAVAGTPIVIDGSYGEGGASLVRTALAMATLTQQPLRIINIRQNAKRSGLTVEDLVILNALAQSSSAEVIGARLGEKSVSFLPTRRPKGINDTLEAADETEEARPHANALVVQNALLPVLARTGMFSSVTAIGETYGANVLTYDYFTNVTLGVYRRMGLYAFTELLGAGFGRGSRGEVSLEIEPSATQGINWSDRGQLVAVKAIIATSELPEAVSARGVAQLDRLGYYASLRIEAEAAMYRGKNSGAFATVWAEFERGFGGATVMGARGIRMEAVVQSAFDSFSEWFAGDATLDPFVADQVLLPAAFSEGETHFKVSKLTQRFLTIAWVIKQFLPIHITVKGQEGQPGSVTVRR